MRYPLEQRAALMRYLSFDRRRRALWMQLRRRLTMGQLTPAEVEQLKREFWQAGREDVALAKDER